MDERIKAYDDKMKKTIEFLKEDYAGIRAGRANPKLLDKVRVDYYGTPTPIQQVGNLSVPEPISWADEERDLSAWLGNELQQDAFNKLYSLTEKLSIINDGTLWADFGHLQESDHLYYMCTKFFSDGEIHQRFNPYDTPYEAFINYMNVLSDFIIRVNEALAVKQ